MSTKTTNLQLTKPAYGEAADIAVINANMDIIDDTVADKVTAPSSTVTTDTVAVFDGTTGKLIKSSGFTIGKSVPSNAVFTDNNTKNTAGTTNKTGTKLFLAGATGQSANPQTYSNSNVYIGTDNALYSNGKQVVNLSDSQALTNKTYNGYTLKDACAKDVDTAVTAGSSKLPTSDAVATAIAGAYGLEQYQANQSMSIGSGTSNSTAEIVLPESGVWMIVVRAVWTSNRTGVRYVGILLNGSNQTWLDARTAYDECYCTATTIAELSENTSIKALGYQNSGTALTMTAQLNAIRLA